MSWRMKSRMREYPVSKVSADGGEYELPQSKNPVVADNK